MANYSKKEISEWNAKDLSSWLMDNKYPGISELCQNNSISGYDLFFIDDNILKDELNLNSFHERKVTMKLINKLVNEHLKLNIINSNGDSVILTLDNNKETSLGELSEYVGGMFNMNPKDILYKDSTKKEVLSPTLKIVNLIILYPHLYKTLNVFNMKDYHQISENNNTNENENENAFQNNENNMNANNLSSENENENESEYQDIERINNINYNYKMNRNNAKYKTDEMLPKRMMNNNKIEIENKNMNKMAMNEDYDTKDMKNKKFRSEQRIYRVNKNMNENEHVENSEEPDGDFKNNRDFDNNEYKFISKNNYRDNNDKFNKNNFFSMRNKLNKNIDDINEQENYNKIYKNVEIREDYYNSALN